MVTLRKEYAQGKVYEGDADNFFEMLRKEGFKTDIQIHDPPYGISKQGGDIKFDTRKDMVLDFGNWDHTILNIPKFVDDCNSIASPNANVVVFFNNWMYFSMMAQLFQAKGYKVDCLIWKKTNPRPQVRKRNFVMCHEAILWAHRGKYPLEFTEHRDMYSVIETSVCSGKERIKDFLGETLHNAQKPLKILEFFIQKLSKEGDTVVDAYGGTLACAEAAVVNNRKFITCELNKEKDYLYFGLERLDDATISHF